MKTIFELLNVKSGPNNSGFELLTENEMQIVRGGTEPTKPISRPREVFDEEED